MRCYKIVQFTNTIYFIIFLLLLTKQPILYYRNYIILYILKTLWYSLILIDIIDYWSGTLCESQYRCNTTRFDLQAFPNIYPYNWSWDEVCRQMERGGKISIITVFWLFPAYLKYSMFQWELGYILLRSVFLIW